MLSGGLVGCYGPTLPAGAPCDVDNECPSSQSCVAKRCTVGGSAIEPGPDGGGSGSGKPGDVDGDGVPDATDNCPNVSNLDQHNEDGDKFGDLCDPCPQIKDDVGADADHDGIGDLCDPNPGVADTVWIFDGFHGLPAWSRSDNWSAVATSDRVQMAAGGNTNGDQGEFLTAPIGQTATPDNFQASTTVMITATMGNEGDHIAGLEIIDAKDTMPIDCSLEIDTAPMTPGTGVFLTDNSQSGGLEVDKNFDVQLNAEYRITLARHGTTYTCTFTRPDGSSMTISGTSSRVPRNSAMVDVGGFGSTAQFGSLEVIGPPLKP